MTNELRQMWQLQREKRNISKNAKCQSDQLGGPAKLTSYTEQLGRPVKLGLHAKDES